jgi:hypothetical protein
MNNLQEQINKIHKIMGVINEQETHSTNDYDFYKTIYNPDDKSVVGAYMVIDETDKMIEVMNIKEILITSSIYMDEVKPYKINVNRVKLPKSQVEILGEVDGKTGFVFIKIPYWLFKKLSDGLEVKRIMGKKRIKISYLEVNSDKFRRDINDPNVKKYMLISDPDEMTHRKLDGDSALYKPNDN